MVYVCYVKPGLPMIEYLQSVEVPDGKAETIVTHLLGLRKARNLDITHVNSLASDGANVMMGQNGGVGALLRKMNPCWLLIRLCVVFHTLRIIREH